MINNVIAFQHREVPAVSLDEYFATRPNGWVYQQMYNRPPADDPMDRFSDNEVLCTEIIAFRYGDPSHGPLLFLKWPRTPGARVWQ